MVAGVVVGVGGAACAVCGSREVRIDAVEHSAGFAQRAEDEWSWLLLAECPRCDHRSTQSLAEAPAIARGAVRVAAAPEVANAA